MGQINLFGASGDAKVVSDIVVAQGDNKRCTIGAGSVVLRDTPYGSVAYGNPCRIKSTRENNSDF